MKLAIFIVCFGAFVIGTVAGLDAGCKGCKRSRVKYTPTVSAKCSCVKCECKDCKCSVNSSCTKRSN